MPFDIARETVSSSESKHDQVSISQTAIRITPNRRYEAAKGILLKAAGSNDEVTNTEPIYIGYSDVTSSNGFAIGPGEAVQLPLSDPSVLFAISVADNQKLFWFII